MTVAVWIPGLPIAQPRTKATLRGAHASVYTPSTADAWKATIAMAVAAEMESPLDGGVALEIQFHMPRPKSHYRKSGALTKSAPISHAQKPDLDNLAKAVKDALGGIAFSSDSQVCDVTASKHWVSGAGGCLLAIRPAEIPSATADTTQGAGAPTTQETT